MELIKDTPFEVAWLPWQSEPGRASLTVIVKASFALVAQGACPISEAQQLPMGELFLDDEVEKSPLYPGDFAPLKPRGEVMLIGHLRTPGGEPTSRVRAAFQVGEAGRQLLIFGDRHWKLTGPSEPLPFTEMPLIWERCFGGAGFDPNPFGRGLHEQAVGGEARVMLPNIEDGRRPIKSRGDRPQPAGVGPIPLAWAERRAFAGTYDAAWQAERWPSLPEDMSWELFNCAPKDLRVRGFFRGDERIQMLNLHPALPRIDCSLPGLRAMAFLKLKGQGGLRDLGLRLDTIVLDLDGGRGPEARCVWRGVTEVRSESLDEIEHLMAVHVPLGDRRRLVDYELWMRRLLAARAEERNPQPEGITNALTQSWATMEWKRQAPEKVRSWREALAVKGDLEENEKQELAARWAHLDQSFTLQEEPQAAGFSVLDANAATLELVKDPGALSAEERASIEAEILSDEAERESQKKREAVVRALAEGESCAGWDLAGADLSGLSFEGGDLRGAILKGANLSRSFFRGTSFEGAVLEEAELSKVRMMGASLKDADLRSARGEEIHLHEVDLRSVSAVACYMPGARFVRCQAASADLSESVLAGASLDDSDFSRARLSAAVLDGVKLIRTSLFEAHLERGASARGGVFDRCDLRGLRAGDGAELGEASLREVRADRAIFTDAKLKGADLRGAALSRADLSGADLSEARMQRSVLRQARMDRATLRAAILTGSDLFQARLERADLTLADLRGCNLYQAELYLAVLRETRLEHANLRGTHVERIQPESQP